MKSRYEPLVKLKKQALEKAEQELLGANREVINAQETLEKAYLDLGAIQIPDSGDISLLSQARRLMQAQHEKIEASKHRLARAEQLQIQTRNLYKQSMIEYEKFNYLKVSELQEAEKKVKREEAKMLDEIGTMTFKKGEA